MVFIHHPNKKCGVFENHQGKWLLNVWDWNVTFFVQIVKKSLINPNFILKNVAILVSLWNFIGLAAS